MHGVRDRGIRSWGVALDGPDGMLEPVVWGEWRFGRIAALENKVRQTSNLVGEVREPEPR